jgi:hypothetical protein
MEGRGGAGRLVCKVLPLAGVIVLVSQLAIWLPNHWRRTDVEKLDFTVYHRTAGKLARGEPIYGEPHILRDAYNGFLYPPPCAALLRPAAALSLSTFQRLWYAVLLLAFWAYAGGLARLAVERPSARDVLVAGTVLLATPGTAHTMSFGNIDVIVWAVVAWGLRGRGAALVLGVALKVFPIFPLLIVARRARAVLSALLLAAAIAGATVLAIGTRPFVDWWRVGLPLLTAGSFFDRNVSLPTTVLRLVAAFGGLNLEGATLPGWARLFLVVAPLVAVAAAARRTRAWSPRARAAAVMLVAVWASPVCWWYQLPLGLVGAAVWWRARHADFIAAPPDGRS